MKTAFGLWDSVTNNLDADFDTEAATLAYVVEEIAIHGCDAVMTGDSCAMKERKPFWSRLAATLRNTRVTRCCGQHNPTYPQNKEKHHG